MIPSLSVVQTVPSRRRNEAPGTLLAAEPERAVDEPGDEPLEADRHLDEPPPEVGHDPVDHRSTRRASCRRRRRRPQRAPAAEQVGDRGRQEVVRVEQAGGRRDDAVAVGVGVVAERDVEAVAQRDQPGHRVRRRRVHPDLAVPVDGHEPERRVDRVVGDRQVEAVALARSRPSRRPTRRPSGRRRCAGRRRAIASMSMTPARSSTYVAEEVVRGRAARPAASRDAGDAVDARRPRSPRAAGSPRPGSSRVTSVSAGPPFGGLYLKPPSSGGLCDGVTTIPSARPRPVAILAAGSRR